MMICPCATTTLKLFVRSIAHIDLQPSFHSSSFSRTFSTPTRRIGAASQPRQLARWASGSQRGLHITRTLQEAEGNGERDLPKAYVESAVMEINSDTIDALAAESAKDYGQMVEAYTQKFSKPRSDRPPRLARTERSERSQWSERPQRTLRPDMSTVPATRGFALHYSSPPIIPIRSADRPPKQRSFSEEKRGAGLSNDRPDPPFEKREKEPWMLQKAALKEKFQEGWAPRKKLSPDALAGIRAIHAQFPEQYSTSALAEKFEVSPEVIRRILKSKWRPNAEEEIERQQSWFKRGEKVWGKWAELGMKPPAKWRKAGVGRREDGQAPLWAQKSARQSAPRPSTYSSSTVKTKVPVTTVTTVTMAPARRKPNEGRTEWSLSERIL
jgi:hypothetical protein